MNPSATGHQGTKECKTMQGHTRSCKVIQGHARSCKVMQGHTRSYKVMQGHTRSYKVMHVAKLQRESVSNSAAALGHKFFAYGEELDWVEVFKYFGRLVTSNDDDDTQAVEGNLAKGRRCWARNSRVLRAENLSAHVNGIFSR